MRTIGRIAVVAVVTIALTGCKTKKVEVDAGALPTTASAATVDTSGLDTTSAVSAAPTHGTAVAQGRPPTARTDGGAVATADGGAGGTYKLGDKLTVIWKGQDYPASILQVVGPGKYKIRYDGYGAEWDEVVGPERIKGKR